MTAVDRPDLAGTPRSENRVLGDAVGVTTFGTLAWLAPLWGLVVVGNAIAIAAIARWGSLDQSLWTQAGAGWQRWVIGGAGISMVSTFLPLFVTHGATRRRLAQAAGMTMVVLAVLGGLLTTLGLWLEGLVFDAQNWPHVIDHEGHSVDDAGLAVILLSFGLTFAAWFVGGWLVACAVHLGGWFALAPGVLVGLLPVVAAELLVMNRVGATQFDFLDEIDTPRLAVGSILAVAAILVGLLVAMRATRSIEID